MNKFFKFLIELFGIANIGFNIFMPIGLTLTIVALFNMSEISRWMLLIIAFMASMYKAVKLFI